MREMNYVNEYIEGFRAWTDEGVSIDNPYIPGSEKWLQWNTGFYEAQLQFYPAEMFVD